MTQQPPVTKNKARRLRLRTAWKRSWLEGGFFHERWDELSPARYAGWHEIANWVKATALLGGLSLIAIMVDTARGIAGSVLKGLSDAFTFTTGDVCGEPSTTR
ncbi:hypothetical protein [Streptomyces torulosus]|uniref:hypothetical protein n=1 Tax=Streptomyces torulosus TaxID=68276 RepID=UPI0006EB649F|nr:hypothetical protein [Streptomyces torulosus]